MEEEVEERRGEKTFEFEFEHEGKTYASWIKVKVQAYYEPSEYDYSAPRLYDWDYIDNIVVCSDDDFETMTEWEGEKIPKEVEELFTKKITEYVKGSDIDDYE